MNDPIYLDNNATTPCDPQVLDKMLPFFGEIYGNPSNGFHAQGRQAHQFVEDARGKVASLIGAQTNEIFFTGGATESNNIALLGLMRYAAESGKRKIITSAVEHKSILMPCKKLEEHGFEVIVLPVDQNGLISVDDLCNALSPETLLVSIHAANNELGSLQPIREIGKLTRERGFLFHCDAAQAVGKIPVSALDWNVDLLSISAHKFYGPKGIGALYVNGGLRRIQLEPIIIGGGQERGLRSGTTNVPGIVGFGEASRIAAGQLNDDAVRITGLRDIFERLLQNSIPDLIINAIGAPRLPNTSSLTFPGIDADALLLNLPEVMMGLGSACTSGAIAPSHVLEAIGLSRENASSTIRASLGRFTTHEDIERAVSMIYQAWTYLGNLQKIHKFS